MATADSTVTYKDIPGFPGYRAGSDGSIWSARNRRGKGIGNGSVPVITDKWRKLKGRMTPRRRLVVNLFPTYKPRFVHRLVLLAFVGPCPEGMECCHADGDPTNNCLSNLRWGTPKENCADRDRHGTTPRGERIGVSKLTAEIVRLARAEYAAGVTATHLAERFGVGISSMCAAIRGDTWGHV